MESNWCISEKSILNAKHNLIDFRLVPIDERFAWICGKFEVAANVEPVKTLRDK